jgi:lipopolysaccharide biosynthesis glycosyltransferase
MGLNILYSFDDGYAQHAGVSLLSLLEHNKDILSLNLYLVDNWLSESNQRLFRQIALSYQRRCNFIHIGIEELKLHVVTNFNLCAYGRLFIANYLKVDEVVYVDIDTVIVDSLHDLEQVNLKNYFVAGVQDTVNPYYLKLMGLPATHRYICSGGIILLNLKLWREKQLVPETVDVINRFKGNPPHHDQGALNYVCKGKILIIPVKYNVMPPIFKFTSAQLRDLFRLPDYYTQKELNDAISSPVVIHYTEEFFHRPWQRNCTHPYMKYYRSQLANSPWADVQLEEKPVSRNCRIQNWMVKYAPYFLYKCMIRFIEYKHERHHLFPSFK